MKDWFNPRMTARTGDLRWRWRNAVCLGQARREGLW